MKNKILTLFVIGVMAIGTSVFAAPCPIDGPCTGCDKVQPKQECCKKMPPCFFDECCFEKCKLAEKLNLTCEQKEKAEKIKNSAMKKQKRIHKQMRKLAKKSFEIKMNAMEEFMEILTPEQKCELKKIKEAKKAEFAKMKRNCPCQKGCPFEIDKPYCPEWDKAPCKKGCDCAKPCDCNKPCK